MDMRDVLERQEQETPGEWVRAASVVLPGSELRAGRRRGGRLSRMPRQRTLHRPFIVPNAHSASFRIDSSHSDHQM